jgi:LysR family pca operon transcriptional activator
MEMNNNKFNHSYSEVVMNNVRRIKLRHLEAFVEIARLGSVSAAALSLHISQPSLTRTVRELEEICEKKLIERDGRGIKLSRFGEIFLTHAGASLTAARNGVKSLAELNVADGPKIKLGALPTVSATMIPEAVDRYLHADMKNPIKIVTGENHVLLNQLRDGELDLVVGRLPAPENMTGLRFEPLYRDKVVFVVHKSHPLARKKQVGSQELGPYPILLPSGQSIIRPFVDRLLIEQGLADIGRQIETVSDSFGRAYLQRYPGIWIISRGVVANELESGEFCLLAINTDSTYGSVGLNVRTDDPLNPAALFFIQILRAVIKDHGLST